MKVKKRMTPDPITAAPTTSHRGAVDLMRQHNIRRLPVVDRKGKLVGIVSETDLLSTAPSQATTLSIYEIYTLLDKLTLDQIMTSPVMTVGEECDLAAAAHFMIGNKIGCLPVMRGDELVGIITETDIYKAFVEVLGGGEPGLRVDVQVPDKKGMLAKVAQAVADAGGNIVALTVFHGSDKDYAEVSLKERGADGGKLRESLMALEGVDNLDMRQGGQDTLSCFGK